MESTDYSGVMDVDILTQKQYLGEKWNNLTKQERKECLVARKPYYNEYLREAYSFVAKLDNQIIGFLLAKKVGPYTNKLYIEYVAINPQYQGMGMGLTLYESLIKKARETGISVIETVINIDNPNSIKLHEKAGFTLQDRKVAVLTCILGTSATP